MRDPLGRRVGAMRGAEGVVDVDVAEGREPARERRIVRLLARLEAHVLEHPDVAVAQRRDHAPRAVADHVRGEPHVRAEQLAEPGGDRTEAGAVVDPPLGPAEMGDDDHARAARAQRLDGRDARP